MATITRGLVATRHGQIHFREAGDGPPVFLLHQSPSSSEMFLSLLPLLAGHRAIALDTLGYGLSDQPNTPPTMTTYAECVADAISTLGYDRAAVFGYHTGAAIAIELAVRFPDRVSALALGAIPYFDAAERADWLQRLETGQPPFAATPVSEDGSHLLDLWRQIRPTVASGEAANRLIAQRIAPPPNARWGFQAAFSYEMAPAFSQIRCPLQVLIQPGDMIAANTARARALLPAHDNVEIPNGRFNEVAGEYAANLLRFLRAVEG